MPFDALDRLLEDSRAAEQRLKAVVRRRTWLEAEFVRRAEAVSKAHDDGRSATADLTCLVRIERLIACTEASAARTIKQLLSTTFPDVADER